MEGYQDNLEIQSRILEGELRNYKVSNKKLQFEIEKEKYFNGRIKISRRNYQERMKKLLI
jgi:hypothetical protein